MSTKPITKNITHLIDANFNADGYFITLTFAPDKQPASAGEARKFINGLLRKIKRFAERQDLPALKYIYTIETSDDAANFHCHILTNFGYRPWVEAFWKHGKISVKPLTTTDGFATYLLNGGNLKTISKSKNLMEV